MKMIMIMNMTITGLVSGESLPVAPPTLLMGMMIMKMMMMTMRMMVIMMMMMKKMLGNHKCGEWERLTNADVTLSDLKDGKVD